MYGKYKNNNNNVDKTMKLKIIKNYIHYPKQIKGLKKNEELLLLL